MTIVFCKWYFCLPFVALEFIESSSLCDHFLLLPKPLLWIRKSCLLVPEASGLLFKIDSFILSRNGSNTEELK